MEEQTNGATPAPAPTKSKQHTKPVKSPLSTKGRKPRHRSTRLEIDRERVTAKIITCLVSGKTIEETSKELDISETWVIRVRAELPQEFITQFAAAKTNEISELIEQGLRAQLLAMIKMVEVTNDEVWLKAQRAPELATFFGVINDKTVRVLAAIERANERAQLEREEIPAAGASEPGGFNRREPTFAAQGA